MRNKLGRLVPVVAAAGIAVSIVGAAAAGAEGFVYTGTDCIQPRMHTVVDRARAEAFVPEPFEVQPFGTDGSLASVSVAAAKCDGVSVAGSAPRETIFSDVGIQIESPDGSPGLHYYMVWQVSDKRRLIDARRALGGRAVLSEILFRHEGVAKATASIVWPENPYRIRVITDDPLGTAPFNETWWQLGERGPIRTIYSFSAPDGGFIEGAISFGGGSVTTEPGTELAQLLGTTRATGNASILQFNFTATVELVTLN